MNATMAENGAPPLTAYRIIAMPPEVADRCTWLDGREPAPGVPRFLSEPRKLRPEDLLVRAADARSAREIFCERVGADPALAAVDRPGFGGGGWTVERVAGFASIFEQPAPASPPGWEFFTLRMRDMREFLGRQGAGVELMLIDPRGARGFWAAVQGETHQQLEPMRELKAAFTGDPAYLKWQAMEARAAQTAEAIARAQAAEREAVEAAATALEADGDPGPHEQAALVARQTQGVLQARLVTARELAGKAKADALGELRRQLLAKAAELAGPVRARLAELRQQLRDAVAALAGEYFSTGELLGQLAPDTQTRIQRRPGPEDLSQQLGADLPE